MKEIDKVALIILENGKILSTKSKGKINITYYEEKERKTKLITRH
jgi:hypothetical protein